MGSFVNAKYIYKYNVIWNKAVTKIFTILTKCFFPCLKPTTLPYFKVSNYHPAEIVGYKHTK